ncbi:hypothetical protein JRQ81_000433 [Phrynocephalus forsythii]|uniref:Myb/SANT-like DNA-binding domain-containing protein n=1 Tax=Phrynocephalus forsythii TaxID=171643 RepID=A0A9Q0Y654_9SAUR|nr:hypothetical protein JRQ81_000433 [Phrynocephalus forsythii]
MADQMGRFWTAHEIRPFLQILIDNNFMPVLFVAGACRNKHTFVHAAKELVLLGYRRNSRQCHSKFKNLRQRFNLAMLNFGQNPPAQHQSPYWAEIRRLWLQSNQPHPGHAFPAGAGPAQDVGQRHMAHIRLELGANAAIHNIPGQQEGGNADEGEGDDQEEHDLAPGMDVMQMGVRRQELEQVIALLQDLAQRVATSEEELANLWRQMNHHRRRC